MGDRDKRDLPEYLTITKLHAYSGIPTAYIRRMIRDGEVEYCKPGAKTFFVKTDSFFSCLRAMRE